MAKIQEIIKHLKETVPPQKLKSKNMGNNTIYYLSWYDLADLLDERIGLGSWSWEITNISTTEKDLFLTGKLTVYADDRTLSQYSTGTEKLSCNSYGDASSNAESMAFRRAAAKFGVCRYLYDKDKIKQLQRTNQTQSPTNKPVSKGEITREQWLQLKANQI